MEKDTQDDEKKQQVEQRRGLLSYAFYGFAPPSSERSGALKEKDSSPKGPRPKTETPSKIQGVLDAIRLEDHVPTDPQKLRQTPLYQSTYQLVQWQRDNYLVGTEYADWKKAERAKEKAFWQRRRREARLPHDPTALGHGQLARLAADFVPSETVQKALIPLIVPLPMNTLFPIAVPALANLIAGQQTLANQIIKSSTLTFLNNPDQRAAISARMGGLLEHRVNKGANFIS